MKESKIMKSYYSYMRSNGNLRVGTYEAVDLASICGISLSMLLFLGAMANAKQAPIAIKDGWYIYTLEERNSKGKPVYFITIDNTIKNK